MRYRIVSVSVRCFFITYIFLQEISSVVQIVTHVNGYEKAMSRRKLTRQQRTYQAQQRRRIRKGGKEMCAHSWLSSSSGEVLGVEAIRLCSRPFLVPWRSTNLATMPWRRGSSVVARISDSQLPTNISDSRPAWTWAMMDICRTGSVGSVWRERLQCISWSLLSSMHRWAWVWPRRARCWFCVCWGVKAARSPFGCSGSTDFHPNSIRRRRRWVKNRESPRTSLFPVTDIRGCQQVRFNVVFTTRRRRCQLPTRRRWTNRLGRRGGGTIGNRTGCDRAVIRLRSDTVGVCQNRRTWWIMRMHWGRWESGVSSRNVRFWPHVLLHWTRTFIYRGSRWWCTCPTQYVECNCCSNSNGYKASNNTSYDSSNVGRLFGWYGGWSCTSVRLIW